MAKIATRRLLRKVLKRLGCEIFTEDNDINFIYNGLYFLADVDNDKVDVDFWYVWIEQNVFTPDDIRKLLYVINIGNDSFPARASYRYDSDDNTFCIGNKISFVLLPEIEDKERYVKVMLMRLIELREFIEELYEALQNLRLFSATSPLPQGAERFYEVQGGMEPKGDPMVN